MPRRRRTSASQPAASEAIFERKFTQAAGLELWKTAAKRLEGSRQRMAEAEDISLGKIQLVPPKHLTKHNKEVGRLIPRLAQRKSLVLNMTNMIVQERPIISRQRPPKGGATTEGRAEETETALNAIMIDPQTGFPYRSSAGRAVQHSQFAIVTLLAEDAWDASPEYDDVLTEEDWKKLKKKEQDTYRKADAKDGTSSYKRPKSTYWRDKAGKGIESADYGRRDPKATKAAFEEARADHLAQHPPFAMRGYSAFDFVYEGEPPYVTYLGIRQLMDVNTLVAKKYRFKGLQIDENGKGRAMMPAGSDAQHWGKGNKLWLLQHYLWLDGDPCVAYQVGGQETDTVGEDGILIEAVINLRERWGFTRLPVGVYEAQHLETDNPDDRPVPYMEPIGDALVAYEGLIGATNITAWRRGTSKIGVVPAQNVPVKAYLDSENQLKPIDVDPEADVVTLYGPTQSIAPIEHSGDTWRTAEQLLESVKDATPAAAASGGEGSSSGREAAVLHTYAQSSQDMTREALRQACEDSASYVLEWACCFMRVKELDEIPIYANVDVEPQEGDDSEGQKTVLVRLREDWIGKNYRCSAEYLPTANPILIAQEADLADRGYGSYEDVQRARGKTNVLQQRIKSINDLYWKSERGQMELSALDARQRGDTERAKAYDAWLSQQATPLAIGPDGKPIQYGPSAALDSMFDPSQQQGGGVQTPGKAALAGTIGGGRGADMQDATLTAGAPAPAGIAPSNGVAPGMNM